MESSAHIVHGGGWVTRQTVGKPKARLFAFLSVIWLIVSIGAGLPFLDGWPETFGYFEWLCTALLIPQPLFIALAVLFLLMERPRPIAVQETNPNYDIRKLY